MSKGRTITDKMNGNKSKLGFIKKTAFPDDTKSIEEWREKTKIGSGAYGNWCKELGVSRNSITSEERNQVINGLDMQNPNFKYGY